MAGLKLQESIWRYESFWNKNEEAALQLKQLKTYYDLLVVLQDVASVNFDGITQKAKEALKKSNPVDQAHLDLAALAFETNQNIISKITSNFQTYTFKQKVTLIKAIGKNLLTGDDLSKINALADILETPSLDSRVKEDSLTGDLDKIFQQIFSKIGDLDEVKEVLVRQKSEIERLTGLLRSEKAKLEREVRRDIDAMPLPFGKFEENAFFKFWYADYNLKKVEKNIDALFPLSASNMKQKWFDIFNSISYRNKKVQKYTIEKYVENVDPATLVKLKKYFNVKTNEEVVQQFEQLFLWTLREIASKLQDELKKPWKKATLFWKEYEFESERQKDFVIDSLLLQIKWFAENPDWRLDILYYYFIEGEAINFFDLLPTWLHRGIWWILWLSIPTILLYATYKTQLAPVGRGVRRTVGRISWVQESAEEKAEIKRKADVLEKIYDFYRSIGDIERAKMYSANSLHHSKLVLLDAKTFNAVLWHELKTSPNRLIRNMRKLKPLRAWKSWEIIRGTAGRADPDSTVAKILPKKDFVSAEVWIDEVSKAMEGFSKRIEKVRNYIRLHPNLSDALEKELLKKLDEALKKEFEWEATKSKLSRTWAAIKSEPFKASLELIFWGNDWASADIESKMVDAINTEIDSLAWLSPTDRAKLKIDAELKVFIDQVWNSLNPWTVTDVNGEKKLDASTGDIEKFYKEVEEYLKKYGEKSEYANRMIILEEFKARALAWVEKMTLWKKIDRTIAEWVWTKAEFKARLNVIVFWATPGNYMAIPLINSVNWAELVRELKTRAEAFDQSMLEWPTRVLKWKLKDTIDDKVKTSEYSNLNSRLSRDLDKMNETTKIETFETEVVKPIVELVWEVETLKDVWFKAEFKARIKDIHLKPNMVSTISELRIEVKEVRAMSARIWNLQWDVKKAVEDKIKDIIRRPGDPEAIKRLWQIVDLLPSTVNEIWNVPEAATRGKLQEQLKRYIKSGDLQSITELKPNIIEFIQIQQDAASIKEDSVRTKIEWDISVEVWKSTINFSAIKAIKTRIEGQKKIEEAARTKWLRLSLYDEFWRLDPKVEEARDLIEARLALDWNDAKLLELEKLIQPNSLRRFKSVDAFIDEWLRTSWMATLPDKLTLTQELDARKMNIWWKEMYYVWWDVKDISRIETERATKIWAPIEDILKDLKMKGKIIEIVRKF